MKTTKKLTLLSAIALMGAAGFTSCASDDEEVITNPNYNPETNEVVTKFVFNVSTGNTPTTRMNSAATQATSNDLFRGIDNCVVYSFKQAKDGQHLASAKTAAKRYDLAQILAPYTVDESKEKSNRVIETSLPLNTNTLLFYGKAIQGQSTGHDAYCEYGHLDTYSLPEDNNISKITIGLGQRLDATNRIVYHRVEDMLSGILTVVMNTNLAGTNHVAIAVNDHPNGDVDVPEYGWAVSADDYPTTLTWADYANVDGKSPVDGKSLYELEKKLAHIYTEMTNIQQGSGELRAGSGKALQLTIHDLWTNVNEVRCAIPLNKPETVAKCLAAYIHANLEKYFKYTYISKDGHGLDGVDYQDLATIADHLNKAEWPASATYVPFDVNEYKLDNKVVELINFPLSFKVPLGAAHLRFDAKKKQFGYVQDYNTSLMGDDVTTQTSDPITVENYCYPAELLYFGNSPIRVTAQEKSANEYPNGVANWDNDEKWTADWKIGHVTSSTSAIAMKNDVNYGTALMKTTVRYGAAQLKDNNHEIQKKKDPTLSDAAEPDNIIDIDGSPFAFTGIIIGGMPQRVGWDFIPKSGAKFHSYIYDHELPGEDANGEEGETVPADLDKSTTPNYTLLFDNYRENANSQDKVYVALEFLNKSGKPFFGEHNMIRNNTHFYLIGELDPEKVAAPVWPEHHALPPYNTDGTSIKTPRVYMQDYMTTADFVISENSLKHALLTVPDLRYSSMTLGLSVDIKWSTGLNFSNIILGGE